MVTGDWLLASMALLVVWLLLLGAALQTLLKTNLIVRSIRGRLTVAGMMCSIIAVASLLALNLSWVSANVSQHLGVGAIRVLAMLLFWPTLVGLALCIGGSGSVRFLGVATCIATGLWWLTLYMSAAISMGAPPMVRHPIRYLIPEGYVGWVTIKHGEDAPSLSLQDGEYICRIPLRGSLDTSNEIEGGWAKDEFEYYREDGSLKVLPQTGWDSGGMIWGDTVGADQPPEGSKRTRFTESFYVGTEDQYHRNVNGSK